LLPLSRGLQTDDVEKAPEVGPAGGTELARDSLSEKIYAQLRLALISGLYEPGSRLNIRGLAAANKTSPTPVREAVVQLVREGALELRLGHQPRVPILAIQEYVKIREVRAPLERLAAELAAVHITADEIAALEKHHGNFVEAERERRWKDALAANQAFHFTIYHASNNDVLLRVIENLWLLGGPFVNNQYPGVPRAHMEAHPHVLIIDALRRRAPGESGELIVRDLREGSYLILERLKAVEAELSARRGRRRKGAAKD
jgi:DNA-binding GntR family transcriptional regulator